MCAQQLIEVFRGLHSFIDVDKVFVVVVVVVVVMNIERNHTSAKIYTTSFTSTTQEVTAFDFQPPQNASVKITLRN